MNSRILLVTCAAAIATTAGCGGATEVSSESGQGPRSSTETSAFTEWSADLAVRWDVNPSPSPTIFVTAEFARDGRQTCLPDGARVAVNGASLTCGARATPSGGYVYGGATERSADGVYAFRIAIGEQFVTKEIRTLPLRIVTPVADVTLPARAALDVAWSPALPPSSEFWHTLRGISTTVARLDPAAARLALVGGTITGSTYATELVIGYQVASPTGAPFAGGAMTQFVIAGVKVTLAR